jgi:hypothetical protein
VALVAGVGDNAGECCADPGFDGVDDGCQRVAVIGFARQGLDVGDELATPGAVELGGNGDLHPELVGPVGLVAFTDAFDLGRMQG